MAKQLNIDVNLNTAKAEAALRNLQQLLTQAIQGAGQGASGALTKDIVKATQEAAKLKTMLASATDTKTGQLNLSKFNQQLKINGTTLQSYSNSLMKLGPAGEKAFLGLAKSVVSTQAPVKQANTMLTQLGTTLKNTARWQLSSSMLHAFIGGIQNAFSYARGLNDSLNSIRIVTGQSVEQMDKFAERANKAAKALSTSTLDYTDAALIYYQQGIRDDAEIKARTDATIKMANVTGQSAQKVSEQMTAIWNNFADGSTNIEYFADVITALGANTASSSAEISQGLQKFAAVADTVGLSYEYATSALATIVATTRQSADVVGTALKTLFARIQDLDLGKTLDDGTTLGKYSKALESVGINIKDQNGELKDMDNILNEMGAKWETLNKDQQVALAQTVAGTRQYTQLVALMDNWDFMKENLQIAYDSEGTLTKQQEIYEESWKAARERVKASMQGLTTDLLDDDFFIGFNDALATAISGLDTFIDSLGGLPGLFGLIGVVATKFFGTQLGQRIDNVILKFKEMTGIAQAEAQVMQQSMNTMMQKYAFNSTGVQGAENQAIQRSIELSSMLLEKKEQLTQADINQAQALIEVTEAYGRSTIAAAQEAEQTEKNVIKERQLAEQKMIRLGQQQAQKNGAITTSDIIAAGRQKANQFNDAANSMQNMINQSEKVRAAMKNIGSGGQEINSLKDGLNQLSIAFEKAGMSTIKLDQLRSKLNRTSEIQAAVQAENELAEAKERVVQAEQKKKDAAKIENKAEKIKAEAAAEKELTEATEQAAQAQEKYQTASKAAEQVISQYKMSIESQINASEQYILALEQSEQITSDMAGTLRQLVPAFIAAADAQETFIQKQREEQLMAERTAQALKQMTASATVSKMGQSMVGVLGTVSSLSMGISSLKSAIDTLNNTELSFGEKLLQVSLSGSMGLSMLISGLMGLPKAFAGVGAAARSGFNLLAASASGATKAQLATAAASGKTGAALTAVAMNGKTLSQVLKGIALNALPVIAAIAAIVAVVAALVKVMNEANASSPEGKLKAAQDHASEMSEGLQEAKTAAQELKESFDSYKSIQDKLKSCTKGTREWTEALQENNNQVLEMLAKYPQLASMEGALIRNQDGSLAISEKAQDSILETANKNIEIMNWGNIVAQQQATMASQNIDNLNLANEIKSEIQKGAATDWYKIFFNGGLDNTKQSKFDLDTQERLSTLLTGAGSRVSFKDQEAIGRREEGGNAPAWAQKDALDVATQAIVDNFDQLSGKTGKELETSLNKIFDTANIKANVEDWAQALEESSFREQLETNNQMAKEQQRAMQEAGAAMVQDQLIQFDQFKNDKNISDIASVLGSTVSEATQIAKDDYLTQLSTADNKVDLGRKYAEIVGGNTDSVMATATGIKFKNAAGEWDEATSEMIAASLAAADALSGIEGPASQVQTALNNLNNADNQSAAQGLKSFLLNGDVSQANLSDLGSFWNEINNGQDFETLLNQYTGLSTPEILEAFHFDDIPSLQAQFQKDSIDLAQQYQKLLDTSSQQTKDMLEERKSNNQSFAKDTQAQIKFIKQQNQKELEGEDIIPVLKSYDELALNAQNAAIAQDLLNGNFKVGTQLTEEQYKAMTDLLGTDIELASVIDTTRSNMITNAETFKDFTDIINKQLEAEQRLAENEAIKEYHDNIAQLEDILIDEQGLIRDISTIDFNNVESILAQADATELYIQQLLLLRSGLQNTIEALNEFDAALEAGDQADISDDYGSRIKKFKELAEDYRLGDPAYKAGMKTFLPEYLQNMPDTNERDDKIIDYINNGLGRYTDLESGTTGSKQIEQLRKDSIKAGIISFDNEGNMSMISKEIDSLEEWGKELSKVNGGYEMNANSMRAYMSAWAQYDSDGAMAFAKMLQNSEDLNDQILASDLTLTQLTEDLVELNNASDEEKSTAKWKKAWEDKTNEVIKAYDKQEDIKKQAAKKMGEYLSQEKQYSKESIQYARDKAEALEKAYGEGKDTLRWTEEDGTEIDLDVNASAVQDAKQKVAELLAGKAELEEPSEIEIKLAMEGFDAEIQDKKDQIEQLGGSIKELDDGSITVNTDGVTKGKEQIESLTKEVNDLNEQKAQVTATFNLEKNDDPMEYGKALTAILEGVPKRVTTSFQQFGGQNVKNMATNIASAIKTIDRRVTVTFNGVKTGEWYTGSTSKTINTGSSSSGPVQHGGQGGHPIYYQGTAQLQGSAHENGSWGIPTDEHMALVGELGQELVVTDNGTYYTVGDNGAELVDLAKGSIIFNHRQTEELLKYRKINTRGQAIFNGTTGNAFLQGTAHRQHTDSTGNTNIIKTVTANQSNNNNNNNNNNNTSNNGAKANKAAGVAAEEAVQYQEKLLLVIRETVDWYKTLEHQLNNLEHQQNMFERNLNRLWGQNLLDNYDKTINAINQTYQALKQVSDTAKQLKQQDFKNLKNINLQYTLKQEATGSKAGERKWNEVLSGGTVDPIKLLEDLGFLNSNAYSLNTSGEIIDFDFTALQSAVVEYMNAATKKYNAAVHNDSLTEVQQVAAENELTQAQSFYDTFTTYMNLAYESQEKYNESVEAAQDALEKMHDLAAEKITKEIEMHVSLNENDKKLIETKLNMIGESVYHKVESLLELFNPVSGIFGDKRDDAFTNLMEKATIYQNAQEKANDGLARAMKDSQDEYAITSEAWLKITQENFDGIMSTIEELLEYEEKVGEYYGNTVDQAIETISKFTDRLDHNVSVLEHLQNLLDLTGRQFDYNAKTSLANGLLNVSRNNFNIAEDWATKTRENREAAEKEYQALMESDQAGAQWYKEHVLDKALEAEIDANEKMYESAEEYLGHLEELWTVTLDKVTANVEKVATLGEGWDYLTQSIDRAKSIQEEYLTTTNKLYETNTLIRKLSKDINNTDSVVSKERLSNFQKEIENAQTKNKLTKSEMDILKARYELLQAEMALEDAKNAKSTVRLQRDSEGNYGYVYTADQDKQDEAEQNLADKQNDLYNLVLEQQNTAQEKIIQSRQEFQDKYNQIWQDYYDGRIATAEERESKLAELKQQYSELWEAYDITLTESDYWLNQVAADGVSEAWANSYQNRISSLDEFLEANNQAHDSLTDVMRNIDNVRKEVTGRTELGLQNVAEKTRIVAEESQKLESQTIITIGTLDEEIDAIENLTSSFASQYTQLQNNIAALYEYAKALQLAMQEKAPASMYTGDKGLGYLSALYNHGNTQGWLNARTDAMTNMQWSEYLQTNSGLVNFGNVAQRLGLNEQTAEEQWRSIAQQGMEIGHDLSEAEIEKILRDNGFGTGGYTGTWGTSGKLALLHEKEIVLNATDTQNILDTVQLLRSITQQIDLRSSLSGLMTSLVAPSLSQLQQNNLQQDVTITAEFPNVTERNEIEEAFKTLINEASQYANRY